ncbi:UNVERIFIED_CONTAM: hypothetical protein FKN15_044315 [Acipenser sinensis]
MQSNLNHLKQEMAMLQAVLEQQGTQESEESPCKVNGQSGEKDNPDSHQTTSCSQGEDRNIKCARSPTPPSTPSDSQLRLKRTPVQVKATINLLSNAATPSQEATTDNDGDGKWNWEEMEKETGDDTSVPEEESARIFPLLVEMGKAASRALDSHGPPIWALDACGPPIWALDTRGPSIWVLDAQAPPTQA